MKHMAATGPSIDIIKDLLARGASVHTRNLPGHTPLYVATEKDLSDHVRVLRDAGAHMYPGED